MRRFFGWFLDHVYLIVLILLITLGPLFYPNTTSAEKEAWIIIVICVILLGFVITIWHRWRQREAP